MVKGRQAPFLPLPGQDLKLELEAMVGQQGWQSGFILAGISSLKQAALRVAGQPEATCLAGPFEMLALAGTISPDGAHLLLLISDSHGNVCGGHVRPGCIIHTTAEVCLAEASGYAFSCQRDPRPGSPELVITRSGQENLQTQARGSNIVLFWHPAGFQQGFHSFLPLQTFVLQRNCDDSM